MDKRAERLCVERVQRGTKLLDRKLGPDWVRGVAINGLVMSDPRMCIIGQVSGHILNYVANDEGWGNGGYNHGLDVLGITSRFAQVSNGFETSDARRHNVHYGMLQDEWEYQLRKLQLDRCPELLDI